MFNCANTLNSYFYCVTPVKKWTPARQPPRAKFFGTPKPKTSFHCSVKYNDQQNNHPAKNLAYTALQRYWGTGVQNKNKFGIILNIRTLTVQLTGQCNCFSYLHLRHKTWSVLPRFAELILVKFFGVATQHHDAGRIYVGLLAAFLS